MLAEMKHRKSQFHQRASSLVKLQNTWLANSNFKRNLSICLVHGDLGPGYILYSSDKNELILLDLDKVHFDSYLLDIRTIAAELKLFFYWYAKNQYLAEPYIGHFLREYFCYRTSLNVEYYEFTWLQAYFMGQRLTDIRNLELISDDDRNWCLETAEDVWRLIDQKSDNLGQPLLDVKAVIFDLYNTLLHIREEDHNLDNFEAVRNILLDKTKSSTILPQAGYIKELYFHEIQKSLSLSREQYPEVNLTAIWISILSRREFGIPLRQLYEDGRKLIREILIKFRECATKEFFIDPNVYNVLRLLRENSIKIGIVSNAQLIVIEHEMARVNLFPLIDCLVISAEQGYTKPDKRLFEMTLERLGTTAEEAVFVGDNMRDDIEGAQQCGMRAPSCSWLCGRRRTSPPHAAWPAAPSHRARSQGARRGSHPSLIQERSGCWPWKKRVMASTSTV
jgi:putative hydrolase of the HAD superfamily